MINLSRNRPVAFVVGAAGFLGSHLSEKLLSKNIQVVGLDNFSTGSRENLEEASKNKDFHIISQADNKEHVVDFSRLDYAFFVICETQPKAEFLSALADFLKVCKEHKPKVVFVSSINLYNNHNQPPILKEAEEKVACFSFENKINARIVRLASVYGPRMHFRDEDPIFRLIQAAVEDKVKDETVSLDFNTRSVYIDDVSDLLIKAVMHGSTAQKIYDGARVNPLSVAEIKQVLLDPVWHENQGFKPTELPSWPTPNLLKTEKELAWKGCAELINSLKATIQYLKARPQVMHQIREVVSVHTEEIQNEPVKTEEKKTESIFFPVVVKKDRLQSNHEKSKFIYGVKKYALFFVLLILITYTTIYPMTTVGIAIFTIKNEFKVMSQKLSSGDFEGTQTSINRVKLAVGELQSNIEVFKPLSRVSFFAQPINSSTKLLQVLQQSAEGLENLNKGNQTLTMAYKVVSGESEGEVDKLYVEATTSLDMAEASLGYVKGSIDDQNSANALLSGAPLFKDQVKSGLNILDSQVRAANESLKTSKLALTLLSGLAPVEGKRNYLVLLFDNNIKRPGGGVIRSYAELSIDNGKIAGVKADDIEKLDKAYLEHIEPPKEVKSDLGVTEWRLREANYDITFVKVAQNAQWLYQKETGKQVSGVIALDIVAIKELSKLIGEMETIDSTEEIVGVNLVSLESSQQKLTSVFKSTIEKVLFSPKKSTQNLYKTIDDLAQEKHLVFYTSEPAVYSYISNIGWAGDLSKVAKDRVGERDQFLGLFESSLSDTNVFIPQKEVSLESTIDQNGGVKHIITVKFKSSSQTSDVYRFNYRVYLQKGSKLERVLWGEEDLTKKVNSFSDYGRAGYVINLELKPKEEKSLVFEFDDMKKLDFENGRLQYTQEVAKQLGGSEDALSVIVNLPSNIKAVNDSTSDQKNGQITFTSTSARDRNFRLILNKIN